MCVNSIVRMVDFTKYLLCLRCGLVKTWLKYDFFIDLVHLGFFFLKRKRNGSLKFGWQFYRGNSSLDVGRLLEDGLKVCSRKLLIYECCAQRSVRRRKSVFRIETLQCYRQYWYCWKGNDKNLPLPKKLHKSPVTNQPSTRK